MISAYDVSSDKKQQFAIHEVFMAKKNENGTISVNRAPASYVVALKKSMNQMALLGRDATGISTLEMQSNPRSVGGEVDSIIKVNGAIQGDWSAITYVSSNKKYVRVGISQFEKIDSIFRNRNWVGLNPKVSGEEGIYSVVVAAADASGASSIKTFKFDTKYYHSGDAVELTGNGTIKASAKTVSTTKTTKKTSSVKVSAKNTSSKSTKKEKSRSSSKSGTSGNSGSNSGSNSGGSSGSNSGNSSNNSSSTLKRGSKGNEVKKLQKRLNELGYGLTVDGDFGANTENAVKDFQNKNGLSVDGVVGSKTWAKLNSNNAVGKGSQSGILNGVSGNSGKEEKPQSGKGSSKENAIVDKNKFAIRIDTDVYSGVNVYTPFGNIQEGPFTVVCKNGKLTEYKIEQGHGIKTSKEPKKSTSDKGNDTLLVFTESDNSTSGERFSSTNGIKADEYITVIGYYNDNGTWYTSKCRMHYIFATDEWWRNEGWKTLSTNISE